MYTTMLVKTDKKLKTEAQRLAKAMGLPLSTIISGYLKKFVAEKTITFVAPMPNAKTRKILEQADRDYRAGKNTSPVFTKTSDAIAWLERPNKKK